MGQSAGAVNVYALLTTPATVESKSQLFHRAVPLSGGISLASDLPPGRIPTLNTAAFYAAQGNQLLHFQVIADGLAFNVAGAAAWVASQTPWAGRRLSAQQEPDNSAVHIADPAHAARAGRVRADPRRCDAAG
jgi:carboxylesterase type B